MPTSKLTRVLREGFSKRRAIVFPVKGSDVVSFFIFNAL
jgi:hypothetical protein